jgi:hypothetical protein
MKKETKMDQNWVCTLRSGFGSSELYFLRVKAADRKREEKTIHCYQIRFEMRSKPILIHMDLAPKHWRGIVTDLHLLAR